jgi:ubiquinone/menaquinone biosynthesis C-methylase UbiE
MNTLKMPAAVRSLLRKRRYLRYRSMMRGISTHEGMKILDVGCGIDGRSFEDFADQSWDITGIDLNPPERVRHSHPNFTYRQMDATAIPFADKSFDLVVSVGMLEHVTDAEAYRKVREEIQRVGKQYIVVVPFKWAWVEPHYGVPFFGALPQSLQIALIRAFNLSGHRNRIDYFLDTFRWRTNAEYRRDFPGAEVRVLPLGDMLGISHSAH